MLVNVCVCVNDVNHNTRLSLPLTVMLMSPKEADCDP